MTKLILSTLCAMTLVLGSMSQSAQACDCSDSEKGSCSAEKAESCSEGDHSCGKECSHKHKKKIKTKVKATGKGEKAKAATETDAAVKTN